MKFDPANPKQGIYDDISIHSYHRGALKGIISKSYLTKHLECPAATQVPDEDSEDKKLGRAMHPYILEGEEAFNREFVVMPDFPDPRPKKTSGWKNTTEYKVMVNEWLSSIPATKEIIPADQFNKILGMKAGVFSNPNAKAFLSQGTPELTLIWQDTDVVMPNGECFEGTGLWCKSRPDWTVIQGSNIDFFDLKKTQKIKRHPFQGEVAKYGYHIQAAMAFEAMWRITAKAARAFTLIAVRDKPPYQCETFPMAVERWVTRGLKDYHRLMQIEAKCRQEKFWPSHEVMFEPGVPINLHAAKADELDVPGWMTDEKVPLEMLV